MSIGHSHSEAQAACHGMAGGGKTTRLRGFAFLATNSLSSLHVAIFLSLNINGLFPKIEQRRFERAACGRSTNAAKAGGPARSHEADGRVWLFPPPSIRGPKTARCVEVISDDPNQVLLVPARPAFVRASGWPVADRELRRGQAQDHQCRLGDLQPGVDAAEGQGFLEKEFARDGTGIRRAQALGSNKAPEFLKARSIDFGSTAGSAALAVRINGYPIKSIYVYLRPEVLLLDEPFSALGAFTRVDLQDHFLALWADSRPTLVHATHDVDEAMLLADRETKAAAGQSMWW